MLSLDLRQLILLQRFLESSILFHFHPFVAAVIQIMDLFHENGLLTEQMMIEQIDPSTSLPGRPYHYYCWMVLYHL